MDSDSCIDSYIVCVLVAGQSFLGFFLRADHWVVYNIFKTGMELGLLMPKFSFQLSKYLVGPCQEPTQREGALNLCMYADSTFLVGAI